MTTLRRRVILHFPGYEPLDAEAHRQRYERAARQSGPHWGLDIAVSPLRRRETASVFEVDCRSAGGETRTRVHVFAYDRLVAEAAARPLGARLFAGYRSAGFVVREGGLSGYVREGWRFALFFLFPFLLVALAAALVLLLALLPLLLGWPALHLLWSSPVAALLAARAVPPFARRFHTLHLFDDWGLAADLATLDDPGLQAWLAACARAARAALGEAADEVLVTSHSMGSTIAAHVLGAILEEDRHPAAGVREADRGLAAGRRILFLTLGGAILQSALLRPARVLRARVGRLAEAPDIDWIEVQCLNDPVHFYRSRVVAACGHRDLRPARIAFIRVKHMLSPEHHRRIRRDALRIHRQYVLGSDRRSAFDFCVLTAGPQPAAGFLRDTGPSEAEGPRASVGATGATGADAPRP